MGNYKYYKYYKIYTKSHELLCYIKTGLNITPEEICERMNCLNCTAIQVTEQCYEEAKNSKYNSWY